MIYYENERANPTNGIYHQHNKNLAFSRHLHDSFELILVTSGTLSATADGREHTLRAGQGLFLFPNCIHSYKTPQTSRCYALIFPAALVDEYYEKHRKSRPVCPLFDFDDPTLPEQIVSAAQRKWLLKSLLYRVVDLFDGQAEYRPRSKEARDLPGQILSLVAEEFDTPLTLRGIAARLGYDHRYLTTVLQRELHTPFRRLLNEYRVSRAQELLLHTDRSVERIAGECGYDSLCSFNRNFKLLTGTTPTAYRKG